MSRTYSAEGFVLKRINIGEADRIITFLLRYKGKYTAIAKGIRKVASRKSPNLELLNLSKIYLARGKTFDVITEAQAIETYKDLKDDLNKISYGFYLVELTSEFLAEGQGGKEVYELIARTLKLLDGEKNIEKIKLYIRAFEIKFLDLIGFKPELVYCVHCRQPLKPTGNYLSPEAGGVLELSCRGNNLLMQPISRTALIALRFLQKEDWPKIQRLVVSQDLNTELERNSRFYLEYLLEKELKSSRFIGEVVKLEKVEGQSFGG